MKVADPISIFLFLTRSEGPSSRHSVFLLFLLLPPPICLSKSSASFLFLNSSSASSCLLCLELDSTCLNAVLQFSSQGTRLLFPKDWLHLNSSFFLLQAQLIFTFFLHWLGSEQGPEWQVRTQRWLQAITLGHWSLQLSIVSLWLSSAPRNSPHYRMADIGTVTSYNVIVYKVLPWQRC